MWLQIPKKGGLLRKEGPTFFYSYDLQESTPLYATGTRY
jgi:hypothetical protein